MVRPLATEPSLTTIQGAVSALWWPKMLIRSKTRCSGRVIPLGYRG